MQQLCLWRGRRLVRSLELVRAPTIAVARAGDFGLAGKLVRLSPQANEVAVTSRDGGSGVMLVDVGTGRRVLLPAQRGLAWSPDGVWLALAGADQILIYGAERSDYVYALPLAAGALAWTS